MVSASAPTERELVLLELEGAAYWRAQKAIEFPDDPRNQAASNVLTSLLREGETHPGPKSWAGALDNPIWEDEGEFTLILSELTRTVGFSYFPRDFEDFIRKLNNDLNWAGRGGFLTLPDDAPTLLLKTILTFDERVTEGRMVAAVAEPWFELVDWIQADPLRAFQIDARKWEEIIAGAYRRAGFDEVVLTPRSGDLGRDVIAVKRGIGTVRVIDQVKAFGAGKLVSADDVRALLGVLIADGASKGFLTTTSDFAPRLRADLLLAPYIPSRLELINGPADSVGKVQQKRLSKAVMANW